MKGIVLAGGAGSRLYPLTQIQTKQLQPIYDKPMIYYPLGMLMLCGIKDILLITTPKDLPSFESLLGDGSQYGISIQYKTQDEPRGIAEAFIIGEDFIQNQDCVLVLGDNLFYGDFSTFRKAAENHKQKKNGLNSRVFAYSVSDPERYGVVEFDKKDGRVLSIEEKPQKPRSHYAIPGLYFFDHTVSKRAKELKPSTRGELEITDLIKTYLEEKHLGVEVITRGMAWFDTGTPQSLLEASAFIGAIEQRQGYKVACLEEIGYRMGYLDLKGLEKSMEDIPKSPYKQYLQTLVKEEAEE